jgi:hypothetical protein
MAMTITANIAEQVWLLRLIEAIRSLAQSMNAISHIMQRAIVVHTMQEI